MLSAPEVNACRFRKVQYGEVIILDPIKWLLEHYRLERRWKEHQRTTGQRIADKAVSWEDYHREMVKFDPRLSDEHLQKYRTIEVAWMLAQPWCQLETHHVTRRLQNSRYDRFEVKIHTKDCNNYGVPTRSRALFDLRNWTGEEDPPACNLEIHPTPITLDPKTFTKDTPFLQQMAYAL
jgi:hypothetical protein